MDTLVESESLGIGMNVYLSADFLRRCQLKPILILVKNGISMQRKATMGIWVSSRRKSPEARAREMMGRTPEGPSDPAPF